MNDTLKEAFQSAVLQVYNQLYRQTRDEHLARRETSRLVRSVLSGLDLGDGLTSAASGLLNEYEKCTDLDRRQALYFKIQALRSAIKIIEEFENGKGH